MIETVRELAQLQTRVDNQVNPEVPLSLVAPFLDLPGKVGLWYAGDVQRSTGNIYDRSGQVRTLTYNGNPVFNYLSNGIAYADLDGVGDYFSRADETDLDVLGTETIYAAATRGLTVGGWFWSNAYIATNQAAISKLNTTGNQISWSLLFRRSGLGNDVSFSVSTDGINSVQAASGVAYGAAAWHFLVGRFVPSTSVNVYLDGVKYTQAVGVPASIFNSTATMIIGDVGNLNATLAGRASIGFISANALPDAMINSLFQKTRGLFRV